MIRVHGSVFPITCIEQIIIGLIGMATIAHIWHPSRLRLRHGESLLAKCVDV